MADSGSKQHCKNCCFRTSTDGRGSIKKRVWHFIKSQTRSQALYTEVQRLKMATAAIPHAPSKMYILVHFWRRVLPYVKTSLLFNTSGIRAASECTSLSILGREFFAEAKNIAAVWNHGQPCPFEKGTFEALLNMSSLGTSGICDKNLHDRRAYVRTIIFCEKFI